MEKNLFGTDGIRAKVGEFPLDIDSLILLGQAIGLWAQKKYGLEKPIVIGNDTRESCDFIKSALKTGILPHKLDILDVGPLVTPGIFQIVKASKVDLGIVISASHNPYEYNGLKFFDRKKGKLSRDDEQAISDLFFQQLTAKKSPCNSFDIETIYHSFGIETIQKGIAEFNYCMDLLKEFDKDTTFLANKKIIVDCAYGAISFIAENVFEEFDNANIIYLHDDPDGTNINQNCGAMHPEKLQKAVIKHKADIGFAFDGDGDRVVVVNRHGEIKNGDDILALLSTHPKYQKEKAVVGTIMSNYGLDAFLHKQNKKLIRTQVGDKHIAQALTKQKLSLGAEPSGHVICRDYLNTGDGIFAALRVAEAAKLTDNWDLKTFEKFPQINMSIPVTQKKDITTGTLAEIIAQAQTNLPAGRTVVRYSGTEPILRVMVEEKEEKTAQAVCATLVERLQKELG